MRFLLAVTGGGINLFLAKNEADMGGAGGAYTVGKHSHRGHDGAECIVSEKIRMLSPGYQENPKHTHMLQGRSVRKLFAYTRDLGKT